MRSMTPPRPKNDTWTSRAARWLATPLLALAITLAITLVSAPLMAPPAHATGDTVALSINNGTTFIYSGSPAPLFTAVVTFGTQPGGSYTWVVKIRLDDGEYFYNQYRGYQSPDGMTVTFSRITSPTPIHVGQRTATASFHNIVTGITVYSNPVTFTVNKSPTNLDCNIVGAVMNFVAVGKPVRVRMFPTGVGQVPVDWQNGTYAVTLSGPATVHALNLVPDSNDDVSVPGPTKIGKYQLTCAFNGTASFAPGTLTLGPLFTFSMLDALGSMKLYSNPTTLKAHQYTDLYVVFRPASGAPMPTGEFQIWLGSDFSTDSIALSASGNNLVHLMPLPVVVSSSRIFIKYGGDFYYAPTTVSFPLTNPPIPSGGGGGGGGGGGKGQATATTAAATATAIADTTATTGGDAATPTAAGAGGVLTSTPPGGDTNGLPLIVALAVLGMLAGLGGAAALAIYVSRRRKALAPIGPGGFEPRPPVATPPASE
jgi:hypothetical protein